MLLSLTAKLLHVVRHLWLRIIQKALMLTHHSKTDTPGTVTCLPVASYYDADQFAELTDRCRHNFRILTLNIESIKLMLNLMN